MFQADGVHPTWENIEFMLEQLTTKMSSIMPVFDCVVGLQRGGVIPANIIAHRYNIPGYYLSWSLRKDRKIHDNEILKDAEGFYRVFAAHKKILIMDDLVDTGRTLEDLENFFIACAATSGNFPFYVYAVLCNKRDCLEVDQCPAFETGVTFNQSDYIYFPWDPKK